MNFSISSGYKTQYRFGAAPLFKYMRRNHALEMLSEGTIRIGTLYEYRDFEKHGPRVGDEHEGYKGTAQFIPKLVATSNRDLPEFFRDALKIGGQVTFEDCLFQADEQSPDCYVYSASSRFDSDMMREMDYDACIKIHDPIQFFQVVCQTFCDKGTYEGLHACVYMLRVLPPEQRHGVHPALIKGP